jgi:hypothetical protein
MSEKTTKKILSFDVGIINLAYCLLEIDYTTNKFTIHDWDIIDTADNRDRCPFVMRGGKVCNKVAQRRTKFDSGNIQYACSAHWNKLQSFVKEVDLNWTDVEEGSNDQCSLCKNPGTLRSELIDGVYCEKHTTTIARRNNYLCKHNKCNNFITNGIYLKTRVEAAGEEIEYECLNCGWCDEHFKPDYETYIKSKTKKISQNANSIPLEMIGGAMYRKLDAKPDFLQVDEVLIENQPALINPTMKSVAMILYSYFLWNCFHKRDETKSTVTNLSYCSASNKLKVGGQKVADRLETARINVDSKNSKKVYNITKDTGKKICRALISDMPEYQKMFNAHKKQDDLADAFLQGLVMNFDEMPDHYARMLEAANIIHEKDRSNSKSKPKPKAKGRGRPRGRATKAATKAKTETKVTVKAKKADTAEEDNTFEAHTISFGK